MMLCCASHLGAACDPRKGPVHRDCVLGGAGTSAADLSRDHREWLLVLLPARAARPTPCVRPTDWSSERPYFNPAHVRKSSEKRVGLTSSPRARAQEPVHLPGLPHVA